METFGWECFKANRWLIENVARTVEVDSTPHPKNTLFRASIQWAVRRTAKSREVSKPRDWMWAYRSDIWQVSRHRCCRDACQFSVRLLSSWCYGNYMITRVYVYQPDGCRWIKVLLAYINKENQRSQNARYGTLDVLIPSWSGYLICDFFYLALRSRMEILRRYPCHLNVYHFIFKFLYKDP